MRLDLRGRVETWEDDVGTYVVVVLQGVRHPSQGRSEILRIRWHVDPANERPRPAPVA